MSGTICPYPRLQFFDTNGNPLNGGKLYSYSAGTSTPLATYADASESVANANPLVLDSAGRGTVFLSTGSSYKLVLKTSADVEVWSVDNITAVPGAAEYFDVTGTAGATLTAGDACFLSAGDGGLTAGRWYRADSGTNYKSSTAQQIGFALSSAASGDSISFRVAGVVSGLSGLTAGTLYYVSTNGALTSSAPALARRVGVAKSTTELIVSQWPGAGDASLTTSGMVNTSTQTFGGAKTFNAQITATAGMISDAPISFRPGTSSAGSRTIAEGIFSLYSDATGVANSGAGMTTLRTVSVPANALVTGGRIVVRVYGVTANNANAKTLRCVIGAVTINMSLGTSAADPFVAEYVAHADAVGVRIYSSLQHGTARATNSGAGAWTPTDIVVSAQGGASSDVILNAMTVGL